MADEIELKLALAQADPAAIEASGLHCGPRTTAQQSSVYFDTPKRALEKAGLLLRIRTSGDKRIQTIKAQGAAASGLFVRPEWECEVVDDLPVLDDRTPIPSLLGKHTADVVPQFTVEIERDVWLIEHGKSTVEMALDRGKAKAGDRFSAICEVELELKSGEPNALFALARQIDAMTPVRLGVLTKAERGYRLAEPRATMFKAEPIGLIKDLTVAQAFQRIVHSCVRQYRLNEDVLLGERNAGALHQCRVALRRLRSAFAIFKAAIGGPVQLQLRDELRWLAGELAEARNLDVMLERIEDANLQHRLENARAAAYDDVEAVIASPRARALMLDLAEWTAGGDWLARDDTCDSRSQPIGRFAGDALDRLRRKVKKRGRDLAHLSDADRHELRKHAKKLRYAAEFFKSLDREKRDRRRFKRFVGALEDLLDKLGALNDLVTAPHTLVALGLTDEPGAQDGLVPGKRDQLLEAAADLHAELIDAKRFWR